MIGLTGLSAIWNTRKIWGGLLLALVVVVMLAAGWFYLDYQHRKNTALASDLQATRQDLATAREENRQFFQGIIHAKQAVSEVNRKLAAARAEADQYRRIFEGHDLEGLALGRPGLITRHARRATERVLSDIEAAINGTDDQPVSQPAADRPRTPAAATPDRTDDRRQALVRVRRGRLSQHGRKPPGLSAGHTAAACRNRLLPQLPRRRI